MISWRNDLDLGTPEHVWQYYELSAEALRSLYDQVTRDLSKYPTFFGMTPLDIHEAFKGLRTELEHHVSMALMGSFEKAIMDDFEKRATGRRKESNRKNNLNRNLKDLYGRTNEGQTVRLEEILDLWKKEGKNPNIIGSYKEALSFRHWLAHGRRWVSWNWSKPKEPFEVWVRARALFSELELEPLPLVTRPAL